MNEIFFHGQWIHFDQWEARGFDKAMLHKIEMAMLETAGQRERDAREEAAEQQADAMRDEG